jgi:hypothetical protein
MEIKVLGGDIPRASEETINSLIKAGLIYIGEDNQLHAIDLREAKRYEGGKN